MPPSRFGVGIHAFNESSEFFMRLPQTLIDTGRQLLYPSLEFRMGLPNLLIDRFDAAAHGTVVDRVVVAAEVGELADDCAELAVNGKSAAELITGGGKHFVRVVRTTTTAERATTKTTARDETRQPTRIGGCMQCKRRV